LLFDKLNQEIDKNKFLLNENKQFIADTVHQIRTPLSNIMMNGDLIKIYQRDNELSKFIDQINASINMLNNSYEDLAYITTYDTIKYLPSFLSISDILKQRVSFFNTISFVNKKNIVSDIEEELFFEINSIEMERLIDNNISNAIKYADINKPINISLKKSNENITMVFASYGNEIKDKTRLFDKNYRENSNKRGLGLGLYMVKGICDRYNIKYIVEYQNGQNIFKYIF
jgi:signal transduction histidine kinase